MDPGDYPLNQNARQGRTQASPHDVIRDRLYAQAGIPGDNDLTPATNLIKPSRNREAAPRCPACGRRIWR
jgi:hypothetical protein